MSRFLDILASFIPNIENFANISFISFGPGWLFGVLGTVAVSIFSLSIGRTRTVISLLSIYVAFVFDKIFPYSDQIYSITVNKFSEYWLHIGIFLATYIVIFIIFNFSFIRKRLSSTEYSLFGIVVLSMLQFGLFISIIFNMMPISLTSGWLPLSYQYFSTPLALFFWALAPLPVLLFIKK